MPKIVIITNNLISVTSNLDMRFQFITSLLVAVPILFATVVSSRSMRQDNTPYNILTNQIGLLQFE